MSESDIYKPEPTPEEQGVEIPLEALRPELLDFLIQEFILREGTDYGSSEVTFETKALQIRRQLEKRKLKIVFDLATETGSIVPVK